MPHGFDMSDLPAHSERRGLHFMGDKARELSRAWLRLGQLVGDVVAEHPESGEVWQYMGSVQLRNDPADAWAWIHEFRHRHDPATGRRRYVAVFATERWAPDPRRVHWQFSNPPRQPVPAFNPADCGGAFDGVSVISDADPGL